MTEAGIAFLAVATVALLAAYIAKRKEADDMQNQKTPGAPAPAGVDFQAKVDLLASAIATAEGFGIAGAIPTVAHNPGDQAIGDKYGLGVLGPSSVTVFPDDSTGWAYLQSVLTRWLSGKSSVYFLSDSIREVARKYVNGPLKPQSSDSLAWAHNVASVLGVSIDTTLAQYLGG